MVIRITALSEPEGLLIKVDGHFMDADVDELLRLVDQEGPVAMDLTDLQSVERAAAPVLRRLIGAGVELRAVSPYVELLLQSSPVIAEPIVSDSVATGDQDAKPASDAAESA